MPCYLDYSYLKALKADMGIALHAGKKPATLDSEQPEKGDFEVVAAVKGINTGDAKRDGHLQSADFFDAEKCPEVTFNWNTPIPNGVLEAVDEATAKTRGLAA